MKLFSAFAKLATLAVAGLLIATPSFADFDKRWYLGLGGGVSFIEPDPVDSGYAVDEDTSTGGKIFLGWDFSERLAFEVYAADLGESTLKEGAGQVLTPPTGAVDYQAAGLSAVYHIYNTDGHDGRMDRAGISLFGKLGGGILDTSSDELTINQLEDYHLMLGLGAEYAFESGLALRAEYEAYDTDAKLASVSLLWRFGDDGGSSASVAANTGSSSEFSSESDSVAITLPTDSVELLTENQIQDRDLDGVADSLDACPGTEANAAIDERGCPMFDKRLEGVNFLSGSATLTASAKSALDKMATDLNNTPEVRIAIMAHTDNQGSASGNLDLSKQRAIAVARYLVLKGVAGQRLRPEAYGESQPIVSNATPEGRTQNRRVEFRALN